MTPLFQETQRVKETCAKLALENAALTAQNAKLRGDIGSMREEVAAMQVRVDEAEALRERDMYHLKLATEQLQGGLERQGAELHAALGAHTAEAARLATVATTHEEALHALGERVESNKTLIQREHTELLSAAREESSMARADLEARCEAARGSMKDAWDADAQALRAADERDAAAREEGHTQLHEALAAR